MVDSYTGGAPENTDNGADNGDNVDDVDAQIKKLEQRRAQLAAEQNVANAEKNVQRVAEKNATSSKPQAEIPVPGVDYTQDTPGHLVHTGDGSPEHPHDIHSVTKW